MSLSRLSALVHLVDVADEASETSEEAADLLVDALAMVVAAGDGTIGEADAVSRLGDSIKTMRAAHSATELMKGFVQ